LPISRHVNFDFGNSSKKPDELLLLDKCELRKTIQNILLINSRSPNYKKLNVFYGFMDNNYFYQEFIKILSNCFQYISNLFPICFYLY